MVFIGDDILEGVHWTSSMDEVFRTNYAKNPTLVNNLNYLLIGLESIHIT